MGKETENRTSIKSKYKKYERSIIIAFAFITGIVCAFAVGIMTSNIWYKPVLVVEYAPINIMKNQDNITNKKDVLSVQPVQIEQNINNKNKTCMYVGSKNSTKYYPPTCSFAKRINQENLRCFVSDDDAIAKGYTRSTACK